MWVARKIMVVHLLVDLWLGWFAVQLYKIASVQGARLIGMPYAPAEFLMGVCTVMLLYGFLAPAKTVVTGTLKSLSIYALTHEECDSVGEAIAGVTKNFQSTLAIPMFFLTLETVVKKIGSDEVMEVLGLKQEEEPDEPSNVVEQFLSLAKNNKFLKMVSSFTAMMMDWLDECVLGYCYMQDKEPMGKAAVTAISIYVKNVLKLSKTAVAVVALKVATLLVVRVLAVVVGLKVVRSLTGFMIFYVAVWGLEFAIQDAIIDNVMMQSLVTEFAKYADDKTMVEAEREAVLEELDGADADSTMDETIAKLLENVEEIKRLMEV